MPFWLESLQHTVRSGITTFGPGTGRHRYPGAEVEETRFPRVPQEDVRPGADDLHREFERDVLALLDPMYHAALCMTGSPAIAEVLVLETFGRAYISFRELLPGADLTIWLYRLLASTYIGFRREGYGPTSGDSWEGANEDEWRTLGDTPRPVVMAAMPGTPHEHHQEFREPLCGLR